MTEVNTTELRALLEEQAKTFEAFKEANDEAQAQIKKLGSADAVTLEKVEKANSAITDLSEKIEEASNAAEVRAQESMEANKKAQERLDALELRLNRTGKGGDDGQKQEKAAEAFWRQETHSRAARDLGLDADVDTFDAYTKAFSKYLRYGDKSSRVAPHLKELSVGVEADGGYWVKPEMDSRIVTRTFETSPIRQIATVVTIGTDALEGMNDTNSGTSGGWVGEKDARSETATPQIGTWRIPVHEQFAAPHVTQKLLDDAAFDVEGWLADKIADILVRTENTAFVTGNGVARPRGFNDYSGAAVTTADATRAWGVLQYQFTGANGGFDTSTVDATASPADELIDLVATLKPVYRNGAVWVMSRATEAEVRKLRDTSGNYVIDRNFSDITRAPFGFNLFGFPIVGAEDMPALATDSFSIAFGNFRAGYTIVERQGIRVLRDPYSTKPFVEYYTTKRVGGDVVDFDAIKLLKFGTS